MSQNGMSAPIPTSVNTYSSLTAKNAIIHTTSRWKIEQPKGSKDGPWVPGAPPCGWSPNIPRANLSAPVPEVETAHELEVSLTSVAEVRFSLVLQPFLENREPNQRSLARTELELEQNRLKPVLPVWFWF